MSNILVQKSLLGKILDGEIEEKLLFPTLSLRYPFED